MLKYNKNGNTTLQGIEFLMINIMRNNELHIIIAHRILTVNN